MFNQIAKTLTSATVVAVLGIGVALAQAPPPKQKQAKDQGEVDLFSQSNPATNTDPKKRLDALKSWKEKYPETDYKWERALFFAVTYQALNQPVEMFGAAKEVLAIDPKDINALGWVTALTQSVPATPDNLSTCEKAALELLQATMPAAGVTDAQWKQMKTAYDVLAHRTLAYIAISRKDLDLAEKEYKKAVDIDPTNAEVAYAIATTIIAQRKPERYPEAIFFLARAASLTGPGALPAAMQKKVDEYLVKTYGTYHGDDAAGLMDLRKLAVGPKPAMPEGFTLKDKVSIENEKAEEFAKSNPQLHFWRNVIKEGLTAPNGEQYFESSVKGAGLPPEQVGKKLKGKLVSMKPAVGPKELVLSIEDGKPEVILKFDTALPGKAEPGTEIEFEGIADSFTKEPFTLTLIVEDKDKITGWPVQATRAPGGQKKGPAAPAGAKKAAPAAKK